MFSSFLMMVVVTLLFFFVVVFTAAICVAAFMCPFTSPTSTQLAEAAVKTLALGNEVTLPPH